MKNVNMSTVVRHHLCRPFGSSEISNSARGIVLLAALVLSSSSLWSQITLVHVTSCGPINLPGTNCTIPATGGGNLLVVGWQTDSAGGSTSTALTGITDNVGNTYAEAGAARATNTALGSVVDIWYAKNIAAGATSIALTPNISVTNIGVVIWEFAGADPSAPLDQTAILTDQASTATPSAAAVTTSASNEGVVSLASVANSVTGMVAGNGFTNDSALGSNGWAHMTTSSAGQYVAQWTQSPAGTYSSCTVSFKSAASTVSTGPASACDLNSDGVVNAADVQLITDMSLGYMPCTANIAGAAICNSTVVQDVVTAALGGPCPTSTTQHSVILSWTVSTSPSAAGYNIYRGTASGGPYSTKLDSAPVTASTYTDKTVVSGQTYYYVATAVDAANDESAYSNETKAVVPTP